MSSYDHLTKEQLIALLQRREREASYGLVWERKEIEQERASGSNSITRFLIPPNSRELKTRRA
jgi:adenine-specific DNA-methyltransferase